MTLGDQIFLFKDGRDVTNKELKEMYKGVDMSPSKTVKRFSYTPSSSPIEGKYLTYQFDKNYSQRTWCPEHVFTNRQIHSIYHYYKNQGYKMVNIGHSIYSLKTTADIISASQGHVGLCSGMAWFSLACGVIPKIWYSTNTNCTHLIKFKQQWERHKSPIYYFDQEFKLTPSKISVDGKEYSHISR